MGCGIWRGFTSVLEMTFCKFFCIVGARFVVAAADCWVEACVPTLYWAFAGEAGIGGRSFVGNGGGRPQCLTTQGCARA